jgi:multiple sugar transport system permease protein
MALTFLLPLVWLVVASLDPNASDALKQPSSISLGNYISVLTNKENLRAYGVGFVISFVESVIVVVLSCMAAYPLSRYRLSYKKVFMNVILFMTALPMIAVIVPVYKMYLTLGLLDSLWGVILYLSASSIPYGIWLMKNFMDAVPIELEEAAWVDGATTIDSITKVVLPLMFPGICTVFIYTFSRSWGNFFVPFILLSSNAKMPASVRLYQFFGQYGLIDYGPLAAYSIIYTLPSIVLYVLSQNYMSKGFNLSGAAKG